MASRLVTGVGTGGAALAAAVQPGLLMPIALVAAVLGGLPLLLIATLALVAVYSRDPDRRVTAEKILDRLLSALRPRELPAPARRRRRRDDPPEYANPARATVKSGFLGDEALLGKPDAGNPAR
ncbi:MAG: hypothetical protein ACRDRX_18515 [Pseudonocardiaceae bacterium]